MTGPRQLFLSWSDLAAVCRTLAQRVRRSYHPDIVVGIARTGTVPGVLIALILRAEFQSLRVPSTNAGVAVRAQLPAEDAIAGRRVLLVDEVSYSGSTLRWAEDALREMGAEDVRTLVLFSTPGIPRTDFAGPETSAIVLQPWIREVAIADMEETQRLEGSGGRLA